MRIPRFLYVLAALTALYQSAFAADLSGKAITAITIKDDRGTIWPNPEQVLPYIAVKPGERLSGESIRTGIEYLYLRGMFRDIRVDAFPDDDGARLEYSLFPITIVEDVVIKGNRALSSKLIEEALSGIEGAELREDVFPDMKANILALYQAEGYFNAKVNFSTTQMKDPHSVALRVDIDESDPTLIEDIAFSGNTVFTRDELIGAIKSKKGRPLRRDVLLDQDTDAISQKYGRAGRPAAASGPISISFREGKAYVSIPVEEGPKVTVAFTGNHEFSAKKLRQSLLIWSERDVSDAVLAGAVENIKNMYKERGYAGVIVDLKKKQDHAELDLEFLIVEGPMTVVKEIIVTGNSHFTTKVIRRQMMLRESGWLRARPYSEDILEKDVDYIKEQYADAGYLSAAVQRNVILGKDGTEAVVSIDISEGPQTRVGAVSFEGNTAFSDAELMERLSLGQGAPFSERMVEEDKYRILSAYSNKGHLYCKVETEKSAARGDMDIRFKITEDMQVSLGTIILRGNRSTRDGVILRELEFEPGDYYDYESIIKSQQRIYRLGYFGLARFEPVRPGAKEQVKDMLLTVEERPAGAVEFGVGYGDLDRLRGFIELSHRNLFGTARYASLRFEESDILTRASFQYREPWFLGRRLESKLALVWSDMERLNPDTRDIYYETRKTSVSYGVEKQFNGLKPSLTYQYENVENYNVQPGAELTPEDSGHVRISSITPGLLLDLRDDFFNPRSGSLHGLTMKEAIKEIGSQADFTKVTLQSSWFFPMGERAVVALSGRAGMAWPHGETPEVPIHERFYLGGSSTVRGYMHDSIGPTGADGTPTGGASMAVFNAEIRTNPTSGFGIVLFADAGNVWTGQALPLDDLRASFGAGLRYNTPIGPFRVDYGQKIHRRPGEHPGEIHFNIGHTF